MESNSNLLTHADQYKYLREELLLHIQSVKQTEFAGAIAAGTVYAWLIINKQDLPSSVLWLVGPGVILLCGIRCLALTILIRQMAGYLRLIEEESFGNVPKLVGWERHLTRLDQQIFIWGSVAASVFLWSLAILLALGASWYLSR